MKNLGDRDLLVLVALVKNQDKRVREWCEDSTKLTGNKWTHLKVTEGIFKNNRGVKKLEDEIIRSFESVEKI